MEVFLNWWSHQRPRGNYSVILAMTLEDLEMNFKHYYLGFKRKCLYIYLTSLVKFQVFLYNYNGHYFSVSQVILTLLFLYKTQSEWGLVFFEISTWNHVVIAVLLHCLFWLWILKAAQTFYGSLIWAPQCLDQKLGKGDWAGTLIPVLPLHLTLNLVKRDSLAFPAIFNTQWP